MSESVCIECESRKIVNPETCRCRVCERAASPDRRGSYAMDTKLNIGAVVFWQDGKRLPDEKQPMGNLRIALLRLFYRRESLPAGYEPHADWYHGEGKLNWEGVYWESAGERVTGVCCPFHGAGGSRRLSCGGDRP